MYRKNSHSSLLSKILFLLTLVFLNSNFTIAQSCIAKIEYETTSTNNKLSGCAPFNVRFKDNNSALRLWNFNDSTFGPATSTTARPEKMFPGGLKDTIYVVTLKKTCKDNSFDFDTVYVTVYAKPKVDFKVDTTSACAIVDKIQFTNLLDKGQYIWKFGDSDPTGTTLENPLKKFSSGGVYDISLTVTNDKNCQTELIKKKFITINSKPNPQFFLDESEGCVPFTVQVTNETDTNFVKIADWKWMLGKEVVHTDHSLKSLTIDKPFFGDFVLVTTSNLGCRDTFDLSVHAITKPDASFLLSKPEICSSDSIKVTNSSLLSSKAIYKWSFDGGVSNKSENVKGPHTLNWQNGGIKKIELKITDSTCVSTSSNNLTIYDSPKVDLMSSKDTLCLGDFVRFKAIPSSLLDYRFFKNNVLYRYGVEDEFTTDTLANGDQFYVIGKDAQGCESRKSTVKKLSIREKPKVALLSSDGDNVICKGDSVIFTGIPSGYSNYTFYSFSKSMQSGVSNVFKAIDLQNEDSVFVEALSDNGCSKTSSNAFVMSVVKELYSPKVNCGKSTNNLVSFVWDTIKGALSYEVSINGGTFTPVGSTNTFSQNIPKSGDSISLSVRAIGNFSCGNSLPSMDKFCKAIFCTPIDLKHTPESEICKGELSVLKLNGISTSNYSIRWEKSALATKDSVYKTLLPNSKNISVVFVDSLQPECPEVELIYRVKVNPIPTVDLISSLPNVICEGTEGVLTAKPSGYDTYTFYNGNEILQNDWRNSCKITTFKEGLPIKVIASKFGCSATSNEILTTVVEPLSQPIVYCGASTTNVMEFVWDQVPGAVGYQVSVNGGVWTSPSSGIKHVLTGLKPGTSSFITVKAIGVTICGNSEVSLQTSCFTNPCTAITYNFAPKASLCKGETTQLKVTGISIPNYLISWNGSKYDKSLSYTIKPSKDTIVRVIVKNSNEPSCPNELKHSNVKVVEQPNVDLQVSPTFFCEGEEVKFLASPSNYENYKFFNQASLLYSGYRNELTVSNLKNGSAIKVVARNGNCIDTSNTISLSVSKPLDQPVVNSGKITNSSIEFVWDSIPNATGYMISVDGAPYIVPSSGNNGRIHEVTGLPSLTKKVVKIIALGTGSCGNSPESDTIIRYTTGHQDSTCSRIDFNKSSDLSICEENQVKLSISSISIVNPIISWKDNSSLNQTSLSFQAIKTDTIKVAIRNPKEPLCPEFRKFIKVKVNLKPLISLSNNLFNDSICEGDEVSFLISPNTTLNYNFYNGNKLIQSSNSNTLVISKVTSDLFIRGVAKDEIGCFSDTTYLDVSMVSKPVVSLIDNSVNSGICRGRSLQLSLSPKSSLVKSYEFFENGKLIQSNTINTHNEHQLTKTSYFKGRAIHTFGCIGDFTIEKEFKPFELPVISINSSDNDNILCERESFTLNVTPSNLSRYIFKDGADTLLNSSSSELQLLNLKSSKNIQVIAIDSNTCVSEFKDTTKLIVHPLPKMLNSSVYSLCSDDSLMVVLTSDIASKINWNCLDNLLVAGEDINLQSGTKIRNKLVSSSTIEQLVVYNVVPTSILGCKGDTQKIQVNVRPIPRFVDYVDSVCSGLNYVFDSLSNGLNTVPYKTTFTWGVPDNSNGTNLSGFTDQTIGSLTFSQLLNNTFNSIQSLEYTLQPKSGAIGTCLGKPFKLKLVVNSTPKIADLLVDSICSGQFYEFNPINGIPSTATIIPSGTKYKWEVLTQSGPLRGASNQLLPVKSVQQFLKTDSLNYATLTIKVTPITSSCVGNTFKLPLVVKPLPWVTNFPSMNLCSESVVNVELSSTVNSNYSWSANDIETVDGESSIVQKTNVINDSLISKVANEQIITYRILPTSIDGCEGSESLFSVKLFQLPIISSVTSDVDNNICDSTDFKVTINPSDLKTYFFFSGKDTLQQSAMNNFTFNSLRKDTSFTLRALDFNGCYSKMSDTFRIVVHPIPSMKSESLYALCSDDTLNVRFKSSQPSVFYWKSIVDRENIEGEDLNWVNKDSLNHSFQNKSYLNDTLIYEVVPVSLKGCVGDTQRFTIEVHPTPVIESKMDSICSGTVFSVKPKNSSPINLEVVPLNTTYVWAAPKITIPAAIKGSLEQILPIDSISQRLTNTTNSSVLVTYNVIPTSGTIGQCKGKSFDVGIVVLPVPELFNQLEDTICSSLTYKKVFNNALPSSTTIVPVGTTYSWGEPIIVPNGSVSGGLASTSEAKEFSQTLINKTLDFGKVNYSLTPKTNFCTGNPFILSLAIAPEPNLTSETATSICSEDQLASKLTASIPSSFQWIGMENVAISGISEAKVLSENINDKLINTATTLQVVNYKITPISERGCLGSEDTLVVSVSPRPSIANSVLDVCSNDSIKYVPNESVSNNKVPASTKYTWKDPVVSGPSIGATSQLSPTNGVFQKLTTEGKIGTIVYTITPFSEEDKKCVGKNFELKVVLYPIPNPIVSSDVKGICTGNSATLSINLDETNYPNTTYAWSTGQSTKNIDVKPSSNTKYTVVAESNKCKSLPDTITIFVDNLVPIANVGPEVVICRGDSVTLKANGGKRYVWEVADGLSSNINSSTIAAAPYVTTTYKVNVYNDYCVSTADVKVIIDRCLKELPRPIPQIITPNGDVANDFWNIDDVDYFTKSTLVIFNRWGSVVYKEAPYLNKWKGQNENGDDLPDGTYYYSLDLGNGKSPYKGYIVVTR